MGRILLQSGIIWLRSLRLGSRIGIRRLRIVGGVATLSHVGMLSMFEHAITSSAASRHVPFIQMNATTLWKDPWEPLPQLKVGATDPTA